MSSDAHLRRDHGTVESSDPYIDWGPDLPGRYSGGRARLLVTNPWTLYVTWESESTPERWRLEIEREDGVMLEAADHAGGLSDLWLRVPARTRGVVHLSRDGVRVASLPFATPPDAPSERTEESWALIDQGGHVHDAAPIGGRALTETSGPSGAGYSSADLASRR